jgi:hypothetical protein
LPPLVFGQEARPFGLQHVANAQGRLGHSVPGDPLPRIEVEHEDVRMFDVVDRGAPGVELDRAHLDEAEEAIEVLDPEPHALAALALAMRSWRTLAGTGGSGPMWK